jgi:hypothetical protein
MTIILKTNTIKQFQCLGADCLDTCCTGFTVQVDAPTYRKYQTSAPELLDFITEKEGMGKVLAFDKETGDCPKMQCGSCTIHADYGTEFLTDTCHLYPRITRQLEQKIIMTGSLSCPEVARIGLYSKAANTLVEDTTDRLPSNLKKYAVKHWNDDAQLALHQRFVSLAEQSESAEQMLSKLTFFTNRFGDKPMIEWDASLDASWRVMDVLLPKAETDPRDPFYLLITFTTLLAATKIKPSKRLTEVLGMIESALNCTIDATHASVNTSPDSMERATDLYQKWHSHYARDLGDVTKKLVALKLSSSLYPFAGLGDNQQQRVLWIAVSYAMIRLGLMSLCYHTGGKPPESSVIQVIQTITRVLDHLTSLGLAIPMLVEAGWTKPERLMGLLKPSV